MTEVISVRFRDGGKAYYFDPGQLTIAVGDDVIVETAAGTEFGRCVEGRRQVDDRQVPPPLRPVLRVATESDCRTHQRNRAKEREAFGICERKIAEHGLEMKLIRVEYGFEGSKIVFFFTADGRVDFRALVKDLAATFRTRIELRQVGVRDEAKMLGGLGICGRPLCCSQFLDQFAPVSIKMAKIQNLSLNPTKISGTCGRLMCCLKYEQNAYEDASHRLPKNESFVLTPDGPGNICAVDLLREEVKVRLDDSPETPKVYKPQEVQVLRSGKGSREGIEIPAERPARCERPQEEPERLLYDFSPFPEDGEDAPPVREKRRRPRQGGGKRPQSAQPSQPPREERRPKRQRPDRAERPADRPERTERPQESKAPAVERIQVKPTGDATAEKKAAADRRAGRSSSPRRFRPRRKD